MKSLTRLKKVPETGFEPARRFQRYHLKVVRLPISPPGHFNLVASDYRIRCVCHSDSPARIATLFGVANLTTISLKRSGKWSLFPVQNFLQKSRRYGIAQ